MRAQSRLVQAGFAAIAAVLLLTGALNLRSTIGRDSSGNWEIDPAAQSQMDQLTGTWRRTQSDLDARIPAYQDELRAAPDNGPAAARLGHAYVQKARESGDPSYYPKSETLFATAFDRNDQDYSAAAGLGEVALARHDFELALEWGERAKAINPYSSVPYGVIGDALIELGRYDEAIAVIQQMVDIRPDLASFARVSYLRELMGDVPGAVVAMEQAAEAGSTSAENVSWTQAQLGNLAFNAGDPGEARKHYEASIITLDGYVYGLAGLGKVAAAEGDFAAAIQHYKDAIKRMPLPEFVIALGDIYQANEQPDAAAQQYELVQAMIRLYDENGVDTDIELALFLADHGSDPAAAVEKAKAGYAKRPSVKSADVLAWALYKAGAYDEAMDYGNEALRLGTRDAGMFFHAGMIAAALGDNANAVTLLERAFAINPAFSLLHAPLARATLDELKTTESATVYRHEHASAHDS